MLSSDIVTIITAIPLAIISMLAVIGSAYISVITNNPLLPLLTLILVTILITITFCLLSFYERNSESIKTEGGELK